MQEESACQNKYYFNGELSGLQGEPIDAIALGIGKISLTPPRASSNTIGGARIPIHEKDGGVVDENVERRPKRLEGAHKRIDRSQRREVQLHYLQGKKKKKEEGRDEREAICVAHLQPHTHGHPQSATRTSTDPPRGASGAPGTGTASAAVIWSAASWHLLGRRQASRDNKNRGEVGRTSLN